MLLSFVWLSLSTSLSLSVWLIPSNNEITFLRENKKKEEEERTQIKESKLLQKEGEEKGRKGKTREAKRREEEESEGEGKGSAEGEQRQKEDRKELVLFPNEPLSLEKKEIHLSHHQTQDKRPADSTQQRGHGVPWHEPEAQPCHPPQLWQSLECSGLGKQTLK